MKEHENDVNLFSADLNPVGNQQRILVLHVETPSLYDRTIVFDAINPFLCLSVFVFLDLCFPQVTLSDLKSNEVT